MEYLDIFINGYKSYASYLFDELIHPSWDNFIYWLILISAFFFLLEYFSPWRKEQATFRKDFWLDFFYMFFNFFLFSLIIYNAASDLVVNLFDDGLQAITGISLQSFNPMRHWPVWAILLVGFIFRDFIQWWVHRLLHRSAFLWEFHKVHHSVQQMGFAAHLRYHWMENIVYRSLEYIPLALLGVGLHDFFIIHIFTIAVGHYNHSNISIPGWVTGGILGGLLGLIVANGLLGVNILLDAEWWLRVAMIPLGILGGAFIMGPFMKNIFNSPEMHIWHHAYDLPKDRQNGVNFGISLAIWDYLWGTVYIPYNGRDIKLGFPNVEDFPEKFIDQSLHGIIKPVKK